MEKDREYIDSTIKLIEEGKKYKKMWEELLKQSSNNPFHWSQSCSPTVRYLMEELKKKYFPEEITK